MALLLYFKAVVRHWWALMSCAVFTAIGFYVAYANKNNDWTVKAIFAVALMFVFVACFLAWLDEHKIAGKYFDERPQIGLYITSSVGTKEWHENIDNANPPAHFSLQYLDGRIPTQLTFDPISSLKGKFSLRFEGLPFVSGSVRHMLKSERSLRSTTQTSSSPAIE